MNFAVELLTVLRRNFTAYFTSAQFGFRATSIVILCWSASVFGAADFSLGGSARSYPLSGVIEAAAGYGHVFWGQTPSGRSGSRSPWYGYLRPKLEGATAIQYNSGSAALELFPVSILGARAGGEVIQNDKDYSAYDCAAHVCRGRFYRTFAEAELKLGAGPVFMQGKWRRERWTQSDPDRGDFIEPTSAFALTGTGDSQTVYQGILGLSLGDEWKLMAGLRYAVPDREELSRLSFLLSQYTTGSLTIALGGGVFESNLKKRDGTVVGFLRWDIWPSVAL